MHGARKRRPAVHSFSSGFHSTNCIRADWKQAEAESIPNGAAIPLTRDAHGVFVSDGERAILVHPLSNLIATEQISAGDWIELDFDKEEQKLSFAKIDEGLAIQTITSLIENGVPTQAMPAKAA
jgi:hypothetical protein